MPTRSAVNAGAERRAIVALFAVFALFVQALIPNLANAATGPGGATAICTEMGLATVGDGAPAQPAPAHGCQHCVCPALAETPAPIIQDLPVAYAVAAAPVADTPRGVRPLPRAPPRPPGQGPPAPNA